jgi:hypothetical protein
MAGKNTVIFGIYKSRTQAEHAVDRIAAAGFAHSNISVLLPHNRETGEIADEKNTEPPEGAATGVATGVILGGTFGVLAGIGAFAIPGAGPVIAAGPIIAALAGIGVGGAVGGVAGALIGMGVPEYEARRYESHLERGGVLLSVHCETSDEVSRAEDLLKHTGALDIAFASNKGDRQPTT